jgi:hypothetical protein
LFESATDGSHTFRDDDAVFALMWRTFKQWLSNAGYHVIIVDEEALNSFLGLDLDRGHAQGDTVAYAADVKPNYYDPIEQFSDKVDAFLRAIDHVRHHILLLGALHGANTYLLCFTGVLASSMTVSSRALTIFSNSLSEIKSPNLHYDLDNSTESLCFVLSLVELQQTEVASIIIFVQSRSSIFRQHQELLRSAALYLSSMLPTQKVENENLPNRYGYA